MGNERSLLSFGSSKQLHQFTLNVKLNVGLQCILLLNPLRQVLDILANTFDGSTVIRHHRIPQNWFQMSTQNVKLY